MLNKAPINGMDFLLTEEEARSGVKITHLIDLWPSNPHPVDMSIPCYGDCEGECTGECWDERETV